MIKIRAKQKLGFRRCGVHHPFAPVEHADDRFTNEELARLLAEPMLTVEILPDTETAGDDDLWQLSYGSPDTETAGDDDLDNPDDPAADDRDEPAADDRDEPPQEPLLGSDERQVALMMAAKMVLDEGNLTADKKPMVTAMEDILGYQITAAERNQAFEALIAAADAPEIDPETDPKTDPKTDTEDDD